MPNASINAAVISCETRIVEIATVGFKAPTDFITVMVIIRPSRPPNKYSLFTSVISRIFPLPKTHTAINESKNCKFVNVLVAIGIPGIGKSSAKSLAKYCAFVESNTTADKKILGTFIEMAKNNFDWTEIEDVG